MKYKEFEKWCNQRCSDGCWGMAEAMSCCGVIQNCNKVPFWKREKYWMNTYHDVVVNQIVIPTNKLIEKYLGDRNEVTKHS